MRTLDRRTLLRGALGGVPIAVGLPPLQAMLDGNGQALAGGRPLPRRFGVFFWGNGVRLDRWVPKDRGRHWTPSEALAPLAGVKDYVSVVSGMNVLTGNERAHHAGCVGVLSGAPMVPQPHPTSGYSSTYSAPSVDQVVANAWARRTRFRSVELGVSRRVVTGEGTTLAYLSHRGADNPCPPEYEAAAAFDRLFGGEAQAKREGKTPLAFQRAEDRSVLDVVMDDVRALRRQLGTVDGHRLDQHLDNLRTIERRLETDWRRPAQCRVPNGPISAPDEREGREPLAEINEAMAHVVALALSCDLTRVFSVLFMGSVSNTVLWQVGAKHTHHKLTHDEPKDQPQVHAGTVFIMKQLARLLEVLKNTPDGAGNLLDRIALLATSDCAHGREHSLEDYPILVAGRAGGALVHPSVHHRGNGENASRVLLTLLRAVGLPLARFGRAGGEVAEGCQAIEA